MPNQNPEQLARDRIDAAQRQTDNRLEPYPFLTLETMICRSMP